MLEEKRHTLYTDKLELNIIELPKMKSLSETDDKLLAWCKFFSAKSEEEFEKVAKLDKYIENAYGHLKEMSADEKKRLEYDERQKSLLDFKAFTEDRFSFGVAEGERIGIEKGRAEGRAEGERIKEQQIMQKMRNNGFTEQQIQMILGAV